MEDLWAFNERSVAQAVFDCRIPIISAVGHETDTTIIDYVADLRAPTPSAAAELAVYDVRQLFVQLEDGRNRLNRLMDRRLLAERGRCSGYERQLRLLSPASKIREKRSQVLSLEDSLIGQMESILKKKRHQLDLYVEQMKGLSPLEKLKSGYSYVEDEEAHNIRSIKQVREGQLLKIRLTDGTVLTEVKDTFQKEEMR